LELDEPYEEPNIGSDNYLLEAMLRLGFQRGAEGSLEPPSWQELLAFQNATLRVSTPGDLEALRSMAFAYIEGLRIGEQPLGRAPISVDGESLEVE
jgi:hypothetical protein